MVERVDVRRLEADLDTHVITYTHMAAIAHVLRAILKI